jgi:hypothetical protein
VSPLGEPLGRLTFEVPLKVTEIERNFCGVLL